MTAGAEAGQGRVPTVALAGRQNVGKSTLANRMAGRRQAIAHETPGVTRDRVDVQVRWNGRRFTLVDTGGYTSRARGIDARVREQAERAMGGADLVLLVVDAQAGIQEEDAALARALRRSDRPVLVVANKVDGASQEALAAEFHGLGLGEPAVVSALHGRASGELLDRILELIPTAAEPQGEPDVEARFALVGRPNVGKSSLFNRLAGEERAVVHEEAGTTRDSVDWLTEVDGRAVRFVDTAGLRRAVKTEGVEYYGLVRSLQAIDRSDVALLVVDASEGLTSEDKRIAARVVEQGRGLVVMLNKWDLVPSEERTDRFRRLTEELSLFPGTPVIKGSALRGSGIQRVLPALLRVHGAWTHRVGTAEVNKVLEEATAAHPIPRGGGHIRYGTQVSSGPPSFVLFGARTPAPSYRRYLENVLRRAFGFDGVPVRLAFRSRRPGRQAR